MKKSNNQSSSRQTNWDGVAQWYDGWMGKDGSKHHQQIAIPTMMEMLEPCASDHILDVGCGQGVLAAPVIETGASYTGVDASKRLLALARKHHCDLPSAHFVYGDATRLNKNQFRPVALTAVTFLLSIQDMSPLSKVLRSASEILDKNGRLIILMTHPCFRIPRQSGWGWDENRKLRYRRVDRYLTKLPVPMKSHRHGQTRSFHRPLEAYINGLAAQGLMIDQIREVPVGDLIKNGRSKAEKTADQEIPLFLGVRAIKK